MAPGASATEPPACGTRIMERIGDGTLIASNLADRVVKLGVKAGLDANTVIWSIFLVAPVPVTLARAVTR